MKSDEDDEDEDGSVHVLMKKNERIEKRIVVEEERG